MKRISLLSFFALALFVIALASKAMLYSETDVDKAAVETLIEGAYINGAFNDLDTETMRAGFHPVFKIHGVNNDALREYPIDDWIAGIEKRKAAADFDPSDQKWDHKFVFVDVTGDAAVAKIELFKDSKHVYTDYLSLLKFSDGWKITDKVYFRHGDT
jgi:hypothetical protein